MNLAAIAQQLEAYTLKCPQEVLLVSVEMGEIEDQIIIFKGFSSSLMRPTDFNPDNPVFPDGATIVTIDRLQSPYQPSNPVFIEKNLTLHQMQTYCAALGLT